MSSSNQQICSCNLIVNEMLAFVQNKFAIMDPVILVRVCSSTFSKDDIEKAKSLLSDIPIEIVQAKKEGKYKDLYDIIETLKSLDRKNAPIFVARDINKLPIATNTSPLLLKENLSLENEIKKLKSSNVTVDQLLLELAKIADGEKVYLAKYDYEANEKDEVSFRKGDLISNVSKSQGWMTGLVLRTGRFGMLPANYVTLCKK